MLTSTTTLTAQAVHRGAHIRVPKARPDRLHVVSARIWKGEEVELRCLTPKGERVTLVLDPWEVVEPVP